MKSYPELSEVMGFFFQIGLEVLQIELSCGILLFKFHLQTQTRGGKAVLQL